ELCGRPGALEHVPCAHVLFERELGLQALPPTAPEHDTRSGGFQCLAESLEGVDPVLQILLGDRRIAVEPIVAADAARDPRALDLVRHMRERALKERHGLAKRGRPLCVVRASYAHRDRLDEAAGLDQMMCDL